MSRTARAVIARLVGIRATRPAKLVEDFQYLSRRKASCDMIG